MIEDPDELAYKVQRDGERFCVVDLKERIVIACNDAANAEQYAVLMNQAFQRGFKAGVRKQREQAQNKKEGTSCPLPENK